MRRALAFPPGLPAAVTYGRSGLVPKRRRLGKLQWLIVAATCCSALALMWVSRGWPGTSDSHKRIQLPYHHTLAADAAAGRAVGGSNSPKLGQVQPAAGLDFPLWWHAPFVANSGGYQRISAACLSICPNARLLGTCAGFPGSVDRPALACWLAKSPSLL